VITTAIFGPMFSGKTTRILRSIELCERYKLSYLSVKPLIDTRFGEHVLRSHEGNKYDNKEKIIILGKDSLSKITNIPKLVFVDEIQFFTQEEVELLLNKFGQSTFVLFFGLYDDYAGVPFPTSEYVKSFSDSTEFLHAQCHKCGGTAKHTQRLINGNPAPLGDRIILGGEGNYEARCNDCWVPPSEASYWWGSDIS